MGGFWIDLPAPPCAEPCTPECGGNGFSCQAGNVCVAYIAMETSYTCEPLPCEGPLQCICAEALCNLKGQKCNNIQNGYKVLCD